MSWSSNTRSNAIGQYCMINRTVDHWVMLKQLDGSLSVFLSTLVVDLPVIVHHKIFSESDWFKLLTWHDSAQARSDAISPYDVIIPHQIFFRVRNCIGLDMSRDLACSAGVFWFRTFYNNRVLKPPSWMFIYARIRKGSLRTGFQLLGAPRRFRGAQACSQPGGSQATGEGMDSARLPRAYWSKMADSAFASKIISSRSQNACSATG